MLAVLLSVIVTIIPTAQVIAKAQVTGGENTDGTGEGKYISEVRVGLGKSVDAAAKSLKGYIILTDDKGNYADLNEGAERKSIIGSKGSKVVLLGYKTTNGPEDAITDLAVMNMDGGYSVKDYEALMDKYLNTQIKPMIGGFMAAIIEYRENYVSANPANKKSAQFAHDMLNLMYDDDTGGYLGDLLLNEPKWEMSADDPEAYNKLTDDEKKKHADLLTIFMQSNGEATLAIQNLLARASDTSDTTWIERFAEADAEALMADLFPTMTITDAEAMMDNIFGDDASRGLSLWDELREELKQYDEAVEYVTGFNTDKLAEIRENISENAGDDMTAEQELENTVSLLEAQEAECRLAYYSEIIAVHDFLESFEYFEDFTLLDYFDQTRAEAASDPMTLYSLVSSLSPGQRASLEFISLHELIIAAVTDSDACSNTSSGKTDTPASIYEGVDREIYKKGGVALTSDGSQ